MSYLDCKLLGAGAVVYYLFAQHLAQDSLPWLRLMGITAMEIFKKSDGLYRELMRRHGFRS